MNLTDSQNVTLTIAPADKRGKPAQVEDATWASSNTEVVSVVAAADGLSCVATAVGPLGDATVSVTCDALIGEGRTELAGTIDITVTAGAATTIAISAGAPSEQ